MTFDRLLSKLDALLKEMAERHGVTVIGEPTLNVGETPRAVIRNGRVRTMSVRIMRDELLDYVENFLGPEEADALFQVCAALPFRMRKARNGFYRHQSLTFLEKPSPHASKAGTAFPLADAPPEIRDLAAKLSEHVTGRTVNYLSVVRYLTGTDHFNWHQHKEDKGHNTPVLIVSTGAERNFSIREKGLKRTAQHVLARHGSLIVLSSEANDTHQHAVLDAKGVTTPRYAVNAKCVDEQY